MPTDQRPVIANMNYPSFLAKSETFIYNSLMQMERFRPICLAWNHANQDIFPFLREDLYLIPGGRGLPVRFLSGLQRWCFGRDAFAERTALKILKDRHALLIHAHFGTSGVYAGRLKKMLAIPMVTTFYGFDVSKLARNRTWLKWYRELFALGDLFLVEGPFMKMRLQELGCRSDKVGIQRIGIPIERLTFRPRKPKKAGEPVVLLFSGRFVEKKGILNALRAVYAAHAQGAHLEFRLIGDGPLMASIRRFLREYGMQDYVHLLGYLPYADYLAEMQKADIFVHTSVTASDGDSEGGAPTTILEAQALGMPVIATRHADIPNVVVPGESALLSPEGDWKDICSNLGSMLDRQEAWEDMGRSGRSHVETHHDIRKETRSLENRYAALLADKG